MDTRREDIKGIVWIQGERIYREKCIYKERGYRGKSVDTRREDIEGKVWIQGERI